MSDVDPFVDVPVDDSPEPFTEEPKKAAPKKAAPKKAEPIPGEGKVTLTLKGGAGFDHQVGNPTFSIDLLIIFFSKISV